MNIATLETKTGLIETVVTLINRRNGDEVLLCVVTQTDRFADVMREICKAKAEQGLWGYEVFETFHKDAPF